MPTVNEAPTLMHLIPALLALEPTLGILGIDDHSDDGTATVWDTWHQRMPHRVTVIHRPSGVRGLGSAYQRGFQHDHMQQATWVLQMDADGSHRLQDVQALLQAREHSPATDLWIGSRYIPGGATPGWPRYRRRLSRMGSWYTRQIVDSPIQDLTSGLKLWRGALVQQMPWSQCTVTGYGFQIATTLWAEAIGAIVHEAPITFVPRQAGQSKLSGAIIREALGTPWVVRRALQQPVRTDCRTSSSHHPSRP